MCVSGHAASLDCTLRYANDTQRAKLGQIKRTGFIKHNDVAFLHGPRRIVVTYLFIHDKNRSSNDEGSVQFQRSIDLYVYLSIYLSIYMYV
jgi:hypothetical protein